MERETLDWKDGFFCVKYEATMLNEPKLVTLWWPIFACPRNDNEIEGLVGLETKVSYGKCAVKVGLGYSGHWREFVLRDGDSTKAIAVETVDVPCPKVRKGIDTQWRRGRWEKYLQSKGWTPA